MEEVVIEKLDELVRYSQSVTRAVIYRGVDDAGHSLIPRSQVLGLSPDAERSAVDRFQLYGTGVDLTHRPKSDLEWMSLAQHHGLATRLMDWTHSILVAAYFAVEKSVLSWKAAETRPDAAVYALTAPAGFAPFHRLPTELLEDPLQWGQRYEIDKDPTEVHSVALPTTKSPFELALAVLFIPPVVSARIHAQSGVFFLPRSPSIPVEIYSKDTLVRLRIPARRMRKMLDALLACGIHRQALFPDLDGIASHANTLALLERA